MSSVRGSLAEYDVVPRRDEDVDDSWVPRFGVTERFAHWWTVVMLAVALITGLGMGDDSGSGGMRYLHVGAVVMIGVGLLVAAVVGDASALFYAVRHLLVFDKLDVAWVSGHIRHPFKGAGHIRWGLFNTGQKLLTWAIAFSVGGVIVTGVLAWNAGDDGGGPHGAAVVLTGVLLAMHVFMAVVNPSTRPALAGMTLGRVRRSWAARHHSGWLDDMDARTRRH